MKSEPLITIASVVAIVTAVLGALVAFGVPLTDEQQQALLGLAAVVAPFVVAYFGRKRVTPTRTTSVRVPDERGESVPFWPLLVVVLLVLILLALVGAI